MLKEDWANFLGHLRLHPSGVVDRIRRSQSQSLSHHVTVYHRVLVSGCLWLAKKDTNSQESCTTYRGNKMCQNLSKYIWSKICCSWINNMQWGSVIVHYITALQNKMERNVSMSFVIKGWGLWLLLTMSEMKIITKERQHNEQMNKIIPHSNMTRLCPWIWLVTRRKYQALNYHWNVVNRALIKDVLIG